MGDRFVQAGTTALFSDGVKVIGSITEVEGLQHASMVVEAAGCVSASNVRFGDCEYMVKKAVS